MAGITYVKSDSLAVLAAGTDAIEVDLGLGIDEAARILGIELAVDVSAVFTANLLCTVEAAYSFDPEDTVVSATDDEQFAYVKVTTSAILASTGAQKQSEVIFLDFSRVNLVTTRNLALLLLATGLAGVAIGKVYYEKFKPTDRELVTLIAQRR